MAELWVWQVEDAMWATVWHLVGASVVLLAAGAIARETLSWRAMDLDYRREGGT